MSAATIDIWPESGHMALYSACIDGSDAERFQELIYRLMGAGVMIYVRRDRALQLDDWCQCDACVRLCLMAALRLAEHEGRDETATALRGHLRALSGDLREGKE